MSLGFGLGYNLLMAIKVITVFILVYIFIPSQIQRFNNEDTFLDRVIISLIHSSIITILIVHSLAFVRLYETFSLLFGYFVTYGIYLWIKGGSPTAVVDAMGMKFVVSLLDMSEGRLGLKGELALQLNKWFSQGRSEAILLTRNAFLNPFAGILPLVVLAAAAYIRFRHSIVHAYLGASDSYVILAWTKYLGFNQIYRDGIYPYGHEAVLSAINKLFLIDPHFIIRFMGPLAGFLIVLTVYYVALKSFKNPHVALLAAFIYGVITDSGFYNGVSRQISALPMEYSSIFLLPGLYFFNLYLKKNAGRYLLLASECLALTLLIHPYITVFLAAGYTVIFLVYFYQAANFRLISRIAAFFSISILIGNTPLIIGWLSGIPFHGSLGYVKSSAKISIETQNTSIVTTAFSESNWFLLIMLVCISIVLFTCIVLIMRKGNKECLPEHLIFTIMSLLFYIMFKADLLGLPVLMDPARTGIYLSLIGSLVYAGSLSFFDIFSNSKRLLYGIKSAVCVGVFIVVFSFTSISIPQGGQMEYDEAVDGYLKIKSTFPLLNWTIISPVEQYQQCMGYGWHYELWEFVHMLDKKPEGEKLVFSTDYVFLFTEKIPLGSDREVNEYDLKSTLPEGSGNMTSFYYRTLENRINIEARAYFWAEEYMKTHNNMQVFLENENVKIYLIKQDSKKPINLLL